MWRGKAGDDPEQFAGMQTGWGSAKLAGKGCWLSKALWALFLESSALFALSAHPSQAHWEQPSERLWFSTHLSSLKSRDCDASASCLHPDPVKMQAPLRQHWQVENPASTMFKDGNTEDFVRISMYNEVSLEMGPNINTKFTCTFRTEPRGNSVECFWWACSPTIYGIFH